MLCGNKFIILSLLVILINGNIEIGLGAQHNREPNKATKGAVVTNGYECAAIGGSILKKGGSAVDAAIAALFCEGIAMPQSMGLGGGFFMTIYIKKNRTVDTLDARETAPIRSYENMFDGNASLASKGGLAVAVPSELKGYWEAHQKYGKLPWRKLIEPSIRLCKRGHLVTKFLAGLFKRQESQLLNNPSLREIFIDPLTNHSYNEGHLLKRLKLGQTLQLIADDGPDALYNGKLTKQFIKDIEDFNGIITTEDLKLYKPKWHEPIKARIFNDQTLYTTPLPGSGVILSFILQILNNFLDKSSIHTVTNWQRLVESFKYGYGKRTELGDPDFVSGMEELLANLTSPYYADEIRKLIHDDVTYQDPEHYGANVSLVEDHGTAHISVLSPNGDAVSVTSTINFYFGAGIRSVSTGIILNDEMDDFSAPNITNGFDLPPSPANFIVPQKRPMSSMCPSIIVDKNGNVKLVIGAAGGSKITTTVALITIRKLLFNEKLQSAIDTQRLHHQLFPMHISHEIGFDEGILDGLRYIGHKIQEPKPNDGFAALVELQLITTDLLKQHTILEEEGKFIELAKNKVHNVIIVNRKTFKEHVV